MSLVRSLVISATTQDGTKQRNLAAGRLAPCRRLSSLSQVRLAMPKFGLSLESTTQLRLAVSCSELSYISNQV